jgi:transposase-like protein
MKKGLILQTEAPLRIYSEAFKKMVVKEVESGGLTKDGAKRRYNIGGKTTVLRWCRKYGNLANLGIRVGIVMVSEEEERQALKRRVAELERALSNAHLKIEAQEVMMKLAKEKYGIEFEKKFGTKQQNISGQNILKKD